MKISFTARHLVKDQATFDELVAGIDRVRKAREYLASAERVEGIFRMRVNHLSSTPELYPVLLNLGKKTRAEGIDFILQTDRGPGTSFALGTLYRNADVCMIYGMDNLHVDKAMPQLVEMAERLVEDDKVLGAGCRTKINLYDLPEEDVMRQFHEVYYMIAAGAREGVNMPLNPSNLNLSNVPSIFAALGDLYGDFAALNHTASGSQKLCDYISYITTISNHENFTHEYTMFIHQGVPDIVRMYFDYEENKFYRDTSKLSEQDRKDERVKIRNFIKGYTLELAKVVDVQEKLVAVVSDPSTKDLILRNSSSYRQDPGVDSEKLVYEVDSLIKEGLG